MKARFYLSPLDAPAATEDITEPTRLLDLFPRGLEAEVVEWFKDGGCVRLNGQIIPPDRWPLITLKPAPGACLDFVYVPAGKKAFAILASVALIALTTAISGGLLGPAAVGTIGLGILGSSFAAGGLGATLAAAAVGLAGSLAISALTAPPKAGNTGQQGQQLAQAGVTGNTVSVLERLPMVFGKIGYSPPHLAPPYTVWDGSNVTAYAVVGLQGRCLIENIKVNGLPIASIAGLEYEAREGLAVDAARTMFTQTVIEERDGVSVTNFKTKLESASTDLLQDQSDPDASSPQWHQFRTAGAWDEVVLRFQFPAGIAYTPTAVEAVVPLRVEIRKVGDASWRALPTFHFFDTNKGYGQMRAEIRLERIKQPAGRHFCCAYDEWPIFDVVDRTGFGQSFQYDADEYFHGPAMDPSSSLSLASNAIPILSGYTGGGYTVSASSEFSTSWRAWHASDSASFGGVTQWRAANNSLPAWLKVQCSAAKTFRSYTIWGASTGTAAATTDPMTWMPQGSNDDVSWTDLDDTDVDVSDYSLRGGTYQIGNPGSYLYYRILFKSNGGAANQQLQVSYINWSEDDAPGLSLGYLDNASSGSGHGVIAIHSGGSPYEYARCRYVSLNSKGARVFLDPDQWEAGEYEIRVKRGQAFYYAQYESTSVSGTSAPYRYNNNATNANYFNYTGSAGSYAIFVGQKNYRTDMLVEAFQTISNDSPFNDAGVAMIAIAAPNIQISSIYAEFTRYAAEWDGSIWQAAEVPTQNPAALYRQILLGGGNAEPVPGESIPEDELADWYENCETNAYQCNAVLQGSSVGEAKQLIATAGYASPRDAETYGVVEDRDTSSDPIRVLLSPANTSHEGDTAELPLLPDAIRAEFSDEDQSYAVEHVIVYRDGMDAATAKVFETINYPGFTNTTKVQARATFDLKQAHLRQVRYARRAGLDCAHVRRGMVVGLSDNTVDGNKAAGWITEIAVNGSGNVTSITLDNIMPWSASGNIEASEDIASLTDVLDPDLPMGVAIRIPGGEVLLKQVSDVSDSNVCTFTTPFALVGSGLEDCLDGDGNVVGGGYLVAAGVWGSITRRCKVVSVLPQGFNERLIVAVDEATGLFA